MPPEPLGSIDRNPTVSDHSSILVVRQVRVGRAAAGQHQIACIVRVLQAEIVAELVRHEHAKIRYCQLGDEGVRIAA